MSVIGGISTAIVACVLVVIFVFATIIPASHYNSGMTALGNGDYVKAVTEFAAAGTYKDASDKITVAERDQKIANRESFTMGEWNGKPIEWKVLDVTDGKALIISNDILTIRQYDSLKSQLGKKAYNDSSIENWGE